ncbi:MAG: glycine cleavage system protein GcvH [Chloroflexota bacterium]
MSDIPADLKYTTDDEWVRVEEDGTVTIGITDYAQDSLSDIVYLELPDTDEEFEAGDTFGVVESVKAAADLIMPVGGTIIAMNENLIDAPEDINEDPYGDAWMIKVKLDDPSELDNLLDATAYQASIDERAG